MKARKIYETMDFERGKSVTSAAEIGLRHKYGEIYDLFEICHNLSTNSENFTWVSEIVAKENQDPFFNIESVFYYTDEEDNKIPEQFVITLYPDEILCHNVITDEDNSIRTEAKFIKITTCFDEDDNGGWNYR